MNTIAGVFLSGVRVLLWEHILVIFNILLLGLCWNGGAAVSEFFEKN